LYSFDFYKNMISTYNNILNMISWNNDLILPYISKIQIDGGTIIRSIKTRRVNMGVKLGQAYNDNDEQAVMDLEPHVLSYEYRIIVAGTRNYNDYETFSLKINKIIKNIEKHSLIFISGMASSGADKLIVDFCNKNNFPFVEFPANWSVGKKAGYERNALMAEYATHLISFWDGNSKGTKHMIDIAKRKNITTRVIKI
jgi:hypothetical protein